MLNKTNNSKYPTMQILSILYGVNHFDEDRYLLKVKDCESNGRTLLSFPFGFVTLLPIFLQDFWKRVKCNQSKTIKKIYISLAMLYL